MVTVTPLLMSKTRLALLPLTVSFPAPGPRVTMREQLSSSANTDRNQAGIELTVAIR